MVVVVRLDGYISCQDKYNTVDQEIKSQVRKWMRYSLNSDGYFIVI